jgi:hypothetical protein
MDDSFYITVLSNATGSKKTYPRNTHAKFTTPLIKSIDLYDNYEVGLKEFQCPISFFMVDNEADYYLSADTGIILDGSVLTPTNLASIPRGNYDDIPQLLKYLNAIPSISGKFKLTYDAETRHVSAKIDKPKEKNEKMVVNLSPKLRNLLGFEQNTPIVSGVAPNPANLYINVPQQLFIFCDIVEPQLLSDGAFPLLRNIGIEDITKFGNLFVANFDNPDYVPVLKTHFSNIEINIKTDLGSPAPFQFGPSLVKVHFRKKRSLQY